MVAPTIFILGAGFTRAFCSTAPLLLDDWGIRNIKQHFSAFPTANSILNDALSERADGQVNLEKLMTRVMGMPYDTPEADRELALLEARLMHLLCDRIAKAKGRRFTRVMELRLKG